MRSFEVFFFFLASHINDFVTESCINFATESSVKESSGEEYLALISV